MSSLATRSPSPTGKTPSAARRSSSTVHQRCPVMSDRSSSSWPSVLTAGSGTRRRKNESAAKYRRPLSAGPQDPRTSPPPGRGRFPRRHPISSASSLAAAAVSVSRCLPPPGVNHQVFPVVIQRAEQQNPVERIEQDNPGRRPPHRRHIHADDATERRRHRPARPRTTPVTDISRLRIETYPTLHHEHGRPFRTFRTQKWSSAMKSWSAGPGMAREPGLSGRPWPAWRRMRLSAATRARPGGGLA